MATGENRKRNSKRRRSDFRTLWGGLFRRNEVQGDDVTHGTLYDTEGEDAEDNGDRAVSRLRRIWAHIGIWKLVAAIVFLLFICRPLFIQFKNTAIKLSTRNNFFILNLFIVYD